MKYLAVLLVIIATGLGLVYDLRGILPSPGNYVTRLLWLDGWSTKGSIGLNCSGFVANAKRERFLDADEMYAGGNGELLILAELPDRYAIDESTLETGDIVAFRGSGYYDGRPLEGVHVAAFVREGVWIDSDGRRGDVREFDMLSRSDDDPWFQGKVRILRWARPLRHNPPVVDTITWFLVKLSYPNPSSPTRLP